MSSPTTLLSPAVPAAVPAVSDPDRLARLSEDVGELAGRSLSGAGDAEVLDRVTAAFALQAQVDALLLAAVGEVEARGLARERGCVSTRAWLRSAHRRHPGEATALVRTARALHGELPGSGPGLAGLASDHVGPGSGCGLPGTWAALVAGEVSWDQARVIAAALEAAAADLPAGTVADAEAALVDAAADLDPSRLAVLGRRVCELIDPAGTQARDEARAAEAEDRATGKRTATLTPFGDRPGGRLTARLDAYGYATLAAWLDAAAAPAPASADPDAIPEDRNPGQRRADALVEACAQALAAGGQDARGGVKPRIVITIGARDLAEGTGTGWTSTGQPISPALTRLLACDAEIITACLRDDGTLLDAGRTRRRFTGKLRLALPFPRVRSAHRSAPVLARFARCDPHSALGARPP